MLTINKAKDKLDAVINKSRVHMYKPIQIAEILYRIRINKDIEPLDLESYRNLSKVWRDEICRRFLNRCSSSSSRFQDDLFNKNAVPPEVIASLSIENIKKDGVIESYIYKCFQHKHFQMIKALDYVNNATPTNFDLDVFLNLFRKDPGLKRSIDKIFEIIVYSLFLVVIKELEATIRISIPLNKLPLLNEFEDLAYSIMGINSDLLHKEIYASLNRVGVTNAADRGLDMWANFGPAIQIKHVSLTEEVVSDIANSISADKIVIVCKTAEEKTITNVLKQIGLNDRIQSIITEKTLKSWYEKGLRGKFSHNTAPKILEVIRNELQAEFPTSNQDDFQEFFNSRYKNITDDFWVVK